MARRDAVNDSTSDLRLRTSAERETVGVAAHYVKTRGVDATPEETFLEELPGARASIRHRLVRGLLRGRPEGFSTHTIESSADSRGPDLSGFPERLDGTDVLERARPLPGSCSYVAYLPFPASETVLVAPIEAIHGYDRFRLRDPTTLVAPEETSENPHPVALVSLLECEGAFSDREQADRIAGELAESVANLALARLADPGKLTDCDSILEIQRTASFSGADPASAIEQLAIEGHPFHPGAKIRRGMTPADSLLYAPEFTDTVDVRFVAVDRSHALEVDTGESLTRRLFDRFDGLEGALERSLPDGRYCEEYAVIPIHPWQSTHVIPDRYAREIRIGRVVPVQGFSWPATPLLNLRTVVPQPAGDDSRALPHLKLAVDVQLTNVVRTVSPQAVSNGPRVTELLARIEERESFDRLAVLAEPAATCYHAPDGPHPDGKEFDDARNLSGLTRENPYNHSLVPGDGLPVAVSSLLAESPATDRPIVFDLLEEFTETSGTGVRAFFERYVDVVVPEQLFLMGKYGVALETHPQNTCVVFEDGEPVATLARDLGGIRVCGDRLAHHGFALEAYPDSDLEASRPGELYEKLYYALFQNHLTELIVTLTRHSSLEESACWAYVRERCVETFEMLRADPTIPEEWTERDERTLFEAPAVHKALTAMRLQGKRHEYVTSRVSNPLARSSE
ncbi:IucA/IucC family protein [Natrialbaceae archaeon A-gly3]